LSDNACRVFWKDFLWYTELWVPPWGTKVVLATYSVVSCQGHAWITVSY